MSDTSDQHVRAVAELEEKIGVPLKVHERKLALTAYQMGRVDALEWAKRELAKASA